jgi:glyoxylase-like metal-dependent hydrolase (beta-lactamase superfamily II)
MPLKYKVFQHGADRDTGAKPNFSGTSTVFYGEKDAVLIDAAMLLSDAHRLVANLLELEKNLTHLYISHYHPDHHFGAWVVRYAFPDVKIVALPSVVKEIAVTAEVKVNEWGRVFGKNVPDQIMVPDPLNDDHIMLEGERIEFSDDWDGDSANNTMIWVPSLRVACGTDVVFNECHLFTLESDAARRVKMRNSLKKLKAMNPRVVIPGHCNPAKLHADDASGIDFCLQYLDVFEEAFAKAKTGVDLGKAIDARYPGMKTMRYVVDWQARVTFPDSCTEDMSRIPILFLDPSGHDMGKQAG